MTKEDYVMFAVFNILFFQGIPLPWQTKRTVFRDRPFPIIVVNKSTRRVPLYINLIGINVIIIIIKNSYAIKFIKITCKGIVGDEVDVLIALWKFSVEDYYIKSKKFSYLHCDENV